MTSINIVHNKILDNLINERKNELVTEFKQVMPIDDLVNMMVEMCIENEQYYILRKYNFNWSYLTKTQKNNLPEPDIMKHFFFDMKYVDIQKYFKLTGFKTNNEIKFLEMIIKYYDYIENNRTVCDDAIELKQLIVCLLHNAFMVKNNSTRKISNIIEKLIQYKLLAWDFYANYIYGKRFTKIDMKYKHNFELFFEGERIQNLINHGIRVTNEMREQIYCNSNHPLGYAKHSKKFYKDIKIEIRELHEKINKLCYTS